MKRFSSPIRWAAAPVVALALGVSSTGAATPPQVVYTSGSHVQTWDPIFPSPVYSYWPTGACKPVPDVGPGANWQNPTTATSFGFGAHPWQPSAGFAAEWINAWSDMNSRGTAGQSWTKYATEIAGNGEFVLNLLADNCSWIYIDGTLVGFQDANLQPRTYPVTLSGTHLLEFIVFDGGGLAGGMYRLETNNGTVFPDDDSDGLTNPEEHLHGTNPNNPDSDGDGATDGEEVDNGTNPLVPDQTAPDADGDGVPDADDAFPNSDLSATTTAGGCNTGVTNQRLANGATFNDLIADARTTSGTHGAWVSAVSALSNGWKWTGLISGQEHGRIVSCVAKQNRR